MALKVALEVLQRRSGDDLRRWRGGGGAGRPCSWPGSWRWSVGALATGGWCSMAQRHCWWGSAPRCWITCLAHGVRWVQAIPRHSPKTSAMETAEVRGAQGSGMSASSAAVPPDQQRKPLPAEQRPPSSHPTPLTHPHPTTPTRHAGPLFRSGASRGHDVQFGIVSAGVGCAGNLNGVAIPEAARAPGSYTSVGFYYEWIQVGG